MWWLGVDVGGTFTDLVVFDPDAGTLQMSKTPSTPRNPSDGLLAGIERLGIDPRHIDRLVHGTTVATNTALERNGARLAVLVTAGHKDVLIVGRGNRTRMYDIKAPPPQPLLPRSRCIEVNERLRADGSVLRALDEAEIERIADRLSRDRIEAVAVCFLHAYANREHERRCAALLSQKLPSAVVTTSAEVLAEFREYERFSTTALNAYVAPRMRGYLRDLQRQLSEKGLAKPLSVMTSNGGSLPADRVASMPILSMLSGPAAGVIAAAFLGAATKFPNLITCDMGGTSADVSLVRNGQYEMTTDGRIGEFPVKIRQIDIHSIAVGGGSIAALGSGGFLTVGPRSAGALPGPACYGRGGTEPTITDANVALGRLGVEKPLGGEIVLDRGAAHRAVERLGAQLHLGTEQMAEGMLRIAAVALSGAIKEVSIMRGHDPRGFALLPFGGAGPLHAAALADELGMRTVIVPPLPGNFSALGLLLADVRRDFVRTRVSATTDLSAAELRARLQELVEQGEAELASAGFPAERRRFVASLDMRYAGQSFELSVPAAVDLGNIHSIERGFHDLYAARYGAPKTSGIEIVSYRVAAWGLTEKPVLPHIDARRRPRRPTPVATRTAVFHGTAWQLPVFDRDLLPPDVALPAPAIIEEAGSSTVVPPEWSASLDRSGCLVLRRKETSIAN